MPIKLKRITLLSFWIFFGAILSLKGAPVKFYSINNLFGISIRETNSVCEDDIGFIWASSKIGILRLTKDDYRFYTLPYESADIFTVKLVYENSNIFAYTNNGQVFLYNPVYDRFEMVFNLNKLANDAHLWVNSIIIGPDGWYYIATSKKIFCYKAGQLTEIEEPSSNNHIVRIDAENLAIVNSSGIYLFDIKSQSKQKLIQSDSFRGLQVTKIYFNKADNVLMIGTLSSGLSQYKFKTREFLNLLNEKLPKQPILAFEQNSDSTMLIGIDGQGIWEVDSNFSRVITVFKEDSDDPYSLNGNGIYDLFCDEKNRVWICSYTGGLSFFDQASPVITKISHHINDNNSLVNNHVNSIIEGSDGKLWFATNNGISCLNPVTNHWQYFYQNKITQAQVFLTLCEDKEGRIWAGSYSSGLYILDGKSGKELWHYTKSTEKKGVGDFIIRIFRDSKDNIWVGGSNSKITCFDIENKIKFYPEESISAFAELSDSEMLLGCNYGISILDRGSGISKKILVGIRLRDLLVIGNYVWCCTSGDGLIKFNIENGKSQKFTTENGLPSNFINSIGEAGGYLWLGTENGICRFNPADNSAVTFSSIFEIAKVSYNARSFFKLRNGNLAWGTNNGAIIFDSNAIKEMPSDGKIFFQNISVSGRSIRETPSFNLSNPIDSLDAIKLKYSQNTISLELIPLNISRGSMFSWQLDGFDKDWSPPSANRLVTYTNLPSGQFYLKIRLYDNSLKIVHERSLAIQLIPPIWKKAWFILLISLIILGVLLLGLLYYIKSLKQKHTEEKVRFFTNTAHDIRTSLNLILAPVEELTHEHKLSETGKYFLETAIVQARKLASVVTQLMDFQKVDIGREELNLRMADVVALVGNRKQMYEPFAKNKGIEIEMKADKESYVTAIDENKIEKVIDNLISNAVKYSYSNGKVSIDLQCESNKWILAITDWGIGISKKDQRKLFKEFYRGENAVNSKIVGSGIGLLLAKDYVGMHHGTIKCDSYLNIGSKFIISIPYKEIQGLVAGNFATEPFSYQENQSWEAHAEPVFGHSPNKVMNLLIVEDNEDFCNFLTNSLAGDFKVFTANDGVKAWDLILKHLPDLVVSDIMMPNMDGYGLCQLIKSTFETSHIPVILLSALSDKTNQLHGLGLGADDYLAKPFDMVLLRQKIKSIHHNREIVREKSIKFLQEPDNEPLLINEHNNKFVKKIMEVVWANISNPEFDKEVFASKMNVSSSLLYKKLKSLTGQSPTDFVKIVRIKHASELIISRKYTVTEVSEMCGFSSVGYFSTVFKKFYGKPPTELLS